MLLLLLFLTVSNAVVTPYVTCWYTTYINGTRYRNVIFGYNNTATAPQFLSSSLIVNPDAEVVYAEDITFYQPGTRPFKFYVKQATTIQWSIGSTRLNVNASSLPDSLNCFQALNRTCGDVPLGITEICEDGNFCNGLEFCATNGTCVSGASSCETSTQVCNETALTCSQLPPTTPTPTTLMPTIAPTTVVPTNSPSLAPTTAAPTKTPTATPTSTSAPTSTKSPTATPTNAPTTSTPTNLPTSTPTTTAPTSFPTNSPTIPAPTYMPTVFPTNTPTSVPTTTGAPTSFPTTTPAPTNKPTVFPTKAPTSSPTTQAPTNTPTAMPTISAPTGAPTNIPTGYPTKAPTSAPTTTGAPTHFPTTAPTTQAPTKIPTGFPTTKAPVKTPASSCVYCTFSQGGYHSKCKKPSSLSCTTLVESLHNGSIRDVQPACIRDRCFVPPITLGNNSLPSGKTVTLTSIVAVASFLSHGNGKPGVFTSNQINPTTSSAGILGNQLLAAMLNQRFMASVNDLSKLFFSSKCASVSPLIRGLSVEQVIYITNQVISGSNVASSLYGGFKPSTLNEALSLYNNLFEGCKDTVNVNCFSCNETDSSLVDEDDEEEEETPSPSNDVSQTGDSATQYYSLIFPLVALLLVAVLFTCTYFYRQVKRGGKSVKPRRF